MRRRITTRRLACVGLTIAAVLAGLQARPSTAAPAAAVAPTRGWKARPPNRVRWGTGATSSIPVPPKLKVGLSYGDTLPNESDAELAATLDDAVAVGVSWVRVDLGWDRIQPVSAAAYDWSSFDRTVFAARARGLSVLPILTYTPPWARPTGCTTPKCAPADPARFATFAGVAATRYAPLGVHTWEVWNEPNVVQFWEPAPSAAQYVALLSLTARAVRQADPVATIISGGLAPAATGGGSISQIEFLTAFCQLGGAALVEAVGYHPYSYPVLPGHRAPWNAWTQLGATSPSFQSVLASHGAPGKPIWITEYGAPTGGPGAVGTTNDLNLANHPDHVDEELQAQMATYSVMLAQRAGTIGALFWYSYRDLGTDPSTVENFFGLRRRDGTAKPAWSALRQAVLAG